MGIYNELRDKIHEAFEFLGSQNLHLAGIQIQLGPDRINDLRMDMGSDYYHLRPVPDRRDCYDFRGIPLIVVGERGACRVVSDVEKMMLGHQERPMFTTP